MSETFRAASRRWWLLSLGALVFIATGVGLAYRYWEERRQAELREELASSRDIHMVECDENGNLLNELSVQSTIDSAARDRRISHIFIGAHGWRYGNKEDALSDYQELKLHTHRCAKKHCFRPADYDSLTFGLYWPSKSIMVPLDYRTMKARAGVVGRKCVAGLIARLQAAFPAAKIHLIGHSFGCKVVLAAVTGDSKPSRPIDTVVLILPAVSSRAFSDSAPPADDFRLALDHSRVDGPIGVIFSKKDSVLIQGYRLAFGEDALGAVGVTGVEMVSVKESSPPDDKTPDALPRPDLPQLRGVPRARATLYQRDFTDFLDGPWGYRNEDVAFYIWRLSLRL